MPPKKKQQKHCDFCAKPTSEVGFLVEGPGSGENGNNTEVYICRNCLDFSLTILEKEEARRGVGSSFKSMSHLPTPKEVVKELDDYIIGQTDAKKTLGVCVVNHYKRVIHDATFSRQGHELSGVELDKSNMLMIGPTGSGKTLLAQTVAKQMNVPFAIGDATTLTEAGYVGEDVENLLLKLIHAAQFDIAAAERGVLYIDEIDKIGSTNRNVSITRDVSGEGVQQGLLKMIEGTVANVPPQGGRKHPEQQYIQIDTSNILFICGGTFVGLDDIVAKRLGKRRLGFDTKDNYDKTKSELLSQVIPEDLVEFGMIPELVGRLPVITSLEELDVDALRSILTDPKNSIIKQYQKLFAMDGVHLTFDDDALTLIAKKAKERETGARALRGVIEYVMKDIMYDLDELNPGSEFKITYNIVDQKLGPLKEAA